MENKLEEKVEKLMENNTKLEEKFDCKVNELGEELDRKMNDLDENTSFLANELEDCRHYSLQDGKEASMRGTTVVNHH